MFNDKRPKRVRPSIEGDNKIMREQVFDAKGDKGIELMLRLAEETGEFKVLDIPTDRYSAFDAIIETSTGKTHLVEIKVRKYTFDAIEGFGGVSVEKVKLERIQEQMKLRWIKSALYLNFFECGTATFVSLNEEENMEWFTKYLRANNVDQTKVSKQIANLSFGPRRKGNTPGFGVKKYLLKK